MEEFIRSLANKVDNNEVEGYVISLCTESPTGDYEIMTGARTSRTFTSPYRLYAALLGRLFHTISLGHPEPETLLSGIIEVAIQEFKEALKEPTPPDSEFTVVGKL